MIPELIYGYCAHDHAIMYPASLVRTALAAAMRTRLVEHSVADAAYGRRHSPQLVLSSCLAYVTRRTTSDRMGERFTRARARTYAPAKQLYVTRAPRHKTCLLIQCVVCFVGRCLDHSVSARP